jgi:hypothetical protein
MEGALSGRVATAFALPASSSLSARSPAWRPRAGCRTLARPVRLAGVFYRLTARMVHDEREEGVVAVVVRYAAVVAEIAAQGLRTAQRAQSRQTHERRRRCCR